MNSGDPFLPFPRKQELQDTLRQHNAKLVQYQPTMGATEPWRVTLWADGARFGAVEVDVARIVLRADVATALTTLNEAVEQLCARYLISIGALHPLD